MYYEGNIEKLENHQIFVFGSNTQGRHGKGSALIAKQKFGAIYGQSEGLQGQSYAIITKDLRKYDHPSRTPSQITEQIQNLYDFAEENPGLQFFVAYRANTKNLNNYTSKEMANFFRAEYIPSNIIFEKGFCELVMKKKLGNNTPLF